jgi:hypothetical protein
MRRNAENLIVLSGATAGRRWRHPVAFVDVIRGAIGEVEDYQRVTLLPIGPAALAGRAVGDVIHLLAELIENATSFSPPDTSVQVGGQEVGDGYVVEISDRGLGMNQADRGKANEQLIYPPEFNLSSTARLGLYVVGRLAERHGIRVHLRDSSYGGTLAIVLIPSGLVVLEHPIEEFSPEPAVAGGAGARRRPALPEEFGPPELLPAAAPPVQLAPPAQPAPAVVTRPRRGSDDDTDVLISPTAPAPVATLTARTVTRNGLPRRVRQASLAPPLRSDPPDTAAAGPAAEPARDSESLLGSRSPAQLRRMMASYQRGTVQGRQAAESPRHRETTQERRPTGDDHQWP